MLVLDTNHVEAIGWQTESGMQLVNRLREADQETATTIVTVEEGMRGWLAEIRRQIDPMKQIAAYGRLQESVEFFASWLVLPWDEDSAQLFSSLRKQGLRVPTLDLKIACIAMAHDATLLTQNTSDFAPVPGLKLENWLG